MLQKAKLLIGKDVLEVQEAFVNDTGLESRFAYQLFRQLVANKK